MATKLTFWQSWYVFWGFGYLVNHRSREIHHISNRQKNCKLEFISDKNKEYVTKKKAILLIKKFNYNGCRWCWKIQDKG